MKFDGIDIFVRDGRAISILNKLKDANSNYIEEYVSTRKPVSYTHLYLKLISQTKQYKSSIVSIKTYDELEKICNVILKS